MSPTSLPSVETAGSTSGPPKGALVLEAKLDGTPDEWHTGFLGGPEATDVRFLPGAIEMAILQQDGNIQVNPNSDARLSYVGEVDISVEPGSDVNLWWTLRQGLPSEGQIILALNTLEESEVSSPRGILQLIHFCNSPDPCVQQSLDRLSEEIEIPGLQTGRKVTLTAVVDQARYQVYLDGQRVIDLVFEAVVGRPTPLQFGLFGPGRMVRGGVVSLLGARVYELPTAGSTDGPPKGALVFEAKLDGTPDEWDRLDIRGDPEASEVRFRQGAIEMAVLRQDGNLTVGRESDARLRYVGEVDISVSPGSEVTFWWPFMWGDRGSDESVTVTVDILNQSLQLIHNRRCSPEPCQQQPPDQLTEEIEIPELQTGRKVTLTAVVDEARYQVYLDGQKVVDLAFPEMVGRPTPLVFHVFGRVGVVSLLGARVYELPPATANFPGFGGGGGERGLNLAGDAAIANDFLRMTDAKGDRAGAAWFKDKLSVRDGFETTFQFLITGPQNGDLDGFACVMQTLDGFF